MSIKAALSDDLSALTTRHLPGDRDVWIFILAELLMFGAFFVAYIVNWMDDVDGYAASQLILDRNLGLINTLFLVTSSWAVASAVNAALRNRVSAVAPFLALAIALGLAFIVVKCVEYSRKLNAGISMMTDSFYMFYFCLTGIHLLHVIAGTIILIVIWTNAREGRYQAATTKGLETGASYWHMVDLLWIFLFSLLYLLR